MKLYYLLMVSLLMISINTYSQEKIIQKTVTLNAKSDYGQNGTDCSVTINVYYKYYLSNNIVASVFVDVITSNFSIGNNVYYNGKIYPINSFEEDLYIPKPDNFKISWDIYYNNNKICTETLNRGVNDKNFDTRLLERTFSGVDKKNAAKMMNDGFQIRNIKITKVVWGSLGWYDIERYLKEKENKSKNHNAIIAYVKKGDDALSFHNYKVAKKYYKEALDLNPDERSAKALRNQIAEIDETLNKRNSNTSGTTQENKKSTNVQNKKKTNNNNYSNNNTYNAEAEQQKYEQQQQQLSNSIVDVAYALNDMDFKPYTFGDYLEIGIGRATPKGAWSNPVSAWGFYNYDDYFSRNDIGLGAQNGICINMTFNRSFGLKKYKHSSFMFASGPYFINTNLDWDTLFYNGYFDNIDFDNIDDKFLTIGLDVGLGYEHQFVKWLTVELYNKFGLFIVEGGGFDQDFRDSNDKLRSFTCYYFEHNYSFSYSIAGAIRFPYIKIALEYRTGTNKYTFIESHNDLFNDDNDYHKERDGKKIMNFLKLSLIWTMVLD